MIFVDTATVLVKAGKGGDGMVSFRREPYVDKGGPDGGDGGRGGNVVIVAERNLNTLAHFRVKQLLKAADGGNGARAKRHGKNGDDLIVKVPVGTIITEGDELVADLKNDQDEVIAAYGGDGGFGNAHFTSSTRQAPGFAERGEDGDDQELTLELKMIADVGLIGLPNAGKSTFLSVVSNARPEIADYPFTTLSPNLGVADVGKTSILIADVPGLIEGASKGKGLGDEFLRHIERTATLIHLIDVYSDDVAADYKTIMKELKEYKVDLSKRQMIVALTKNDGVDQEFVDMQLASLKKAAKGKEIFVISSIAHAGVSDLLQAAKKQVIDYREQVEKVEEAAAEESVVRLAPEANAWRIREAKDGSILVSGRKIEKFARRTDPENQQAINRLRDIMYKMGIERELKRRKIEPGTIIRIGKSDAIEFEY